MTTTADAKAQPQPLDSSFRPVVPLPDTPLFVNRRHRTPPGSRQPIFSDDTWPLHHLGFSENHDAKNIDFTLVPAAHRELTKVYLFNVINAEPQRRSTAMHARLLGPGSIRNIFAAARKFTAWLDSSGISSIVDVTPNNWDEYAKYVARRGVGNDDDRSQLTYITRLWAHNVDLPVSHGFAMPIWFGRRLNRWVGSTNGRYGNRTDPFHPTAVSALVTAALEIVDGYLDGSLPLGRHAVAAQVRQWFAEQGTPLPPGRVQELARRRWLKATGAVRPFAKGDVRSAAFVVLSYFTGMRPQEVLHLERDCLTFVPAGAHGSRAAEYTIRGRAFKGQRDEFGDHVSEGVQRDQPWVTIAPSARAVEALEQLAPADTPYLFALTVRVNRDQRDRHGDICTTQNMGYRLGDFVRVWNSHAERDGGIPVPVSGPASILTSEEQPTDPDQLTVSRLRTRISPARFRRTLAWHIANQPGGEIALGIQYGHVKSVISLGYAGRAESGFPDEIELDALLGSWNDLDDLSHQVADGSTISGPAAVRVRDGLDTFAATFAGAVKTSADLRRFQRSGLGLIHDNPNAHNVCAYSAASALCHPNRAVDNDARTPDLTNCQRGCPNIALFDSHVEAKEVQRNELLAEVDLLPLPLAERNRQIADAIGREIDRHRRSRE